DICGHLWYGDNGRDAQRRETGSARNDKDWGEQTETLIAGAEKTRGGTCEVMFSSSTEMNGSVYTKDAPLITTSTEFGPGPMFHGNMWTEWQPVEGEPGDGLYYRTVQDFPGSHVAEGSSHPTEAKAK